MAFVTRKTSAVLLAAICIVSTAPLPQKAKAQGDQPRAVTDAYTASGLDLFKEFAAKPGNIVFSPYSIGTAMAMVLSGARGQTEKEMLAALKHTLGRDEIDTANAAILAALNAYDHSAVAPTCPPGTVLSGAKCACPSPPNPGLRCFAGDPILPASAKLLTANALMLTKHGGLISKDYAALLQSKYSAEVFQKADLAQINGWASRKTEGKIDKILERLDPESAAVLLNAVYFKSRWLTPFEKNLTRDESFSLSPTQQVRLPTMRQTGHYLLANRAGYRAIRLPYAIRQLGMVIVVPNQVDGLADVSRRIDAKELSSMLAQLRDGISINVDLTLPRFKTEYRTSLVDAFQRTGLKLAFDDKRADFSGMTGRPVPPVDLYVSQIVHRAVIEVSEESTEAAAVTAVEMARPASVPMRPTEPIPFRVDRPFLFYIVDNATGAVLFQGRITDPRQTVVAAR